MGCPNVVGIVQGWGMGLGLDAAAKALEVEQALGVVHYVRTARIGTGYVAWCGAYLPNGVVLSWGWRNVTCPDCCDARVPR